MQNMSENTVRIKQEVEDVGYSHAAYLCDVKIKVTTGKLKKAFRLEGYLIKEGDRVVFYVSKNH